MSKISYLFIKVTLLTLIVSVCICSTSCDLLYSFLNSNELTQAEWNSALNEQRFHNVTINGGENYIFKIVGGKIYLNDKIIDDEDEDYYTAKMIISILNHCDKNNFSYDSKNNVYAAKSKVDFYFPMKVEVGGVFDTDATVDIIGEARNLMLIFDSEKNLQKLICNLTLTFEVLGIKKTTETSSFVVSFSDYGTTTVNKK